MSVIVRRNGWLLRFKDCLASWATGELALDCASQMEGAGKSRREGARGNYEPPPRSRFPLTFVMRIGWVITEAIAHAMRISCPPPSPVLPSMWRTDRVAFGFFMAAFRWWGNMCSGSSSLERKMIFAVPEQVGLLDGCAMIHVSGRRCRRWDGL